MSAMAESTGPPRAAPAAVCQCFAELGNGRVCGRPSIGLCFGLSAELSACRRHAARIVSGDEVIATVCEWAPAHLKGVSDVYRMCAAFWSRADPRGSSDGVAELAEALAYLFTLDRLRSMAAEWGITRHWIAPKIVKARVARRLVERMRALWALSERAGAVAALRRLQRRWRETRASRALEALHGPYPRCAAINDCDPFTMDALEDIPADERFSFRDARGDVYAFRAAELAHYLCESGVGAAGCAPGARALNPYNRERIGDADVARLWRIVWKSGERSGACFERFKELSDINELWRTGRDAYAYTLHFYEREGFYCDVDAFLQLSSEDIAVVFAFFQEATRGLDDARDLFAKETWTRAYEGATEDRLRRMQFAFCREMLELVRTPREFKFFLLCNLFVAIAAVSAAISRSLPTWVFNGAGIEDMPAAVAGVRGGVARASASAIVGRASFQHLADDRLFIAYAQQVRRIANASAGQLGRNYRARG